MILPYIIMGLLIILVLVNLLIFLINKWVKFMNYKLTGVAYYVLSFFIIFIVGTLVGIYIICTVL